MSLIWHIAWKDLRRLRALLGLWVALIAAKLGVGVMLVLGFGGQFEPLAYASYGLAALEVLVGYFFVAAIFHGDVLVGSTSFWMTRPISVSRLFVGKLAGLGVIFGVLPLVLALPWWLFCGYGFREILLASVETLAWYGFVVAVALPAATLTDGLPRFLFWTLILFTTFIGMAAKVASSNMGGVFAALAVFAGGSFVGAALHFFRRRFAIMGTLVGPGLAFAGAFTAIWATRNAAPFSRPSSSSEALNPHGETTSLALVRATVWERGVQNIPLTLAFRADGLPTEMFLEGTAIHEWRWPDGFKLERESWLQGPSSNAARLALGLPQEKDPDRLLRMEVSRLGGFHAPSTREEFPRVLSEVRVPAEFQTRVRRDPPAYSLRANLRLMRPVLVGERPAIKGEEIADASMVTRLIDVRRTSERPEAVWVTLSERIPALIGAGRDVVGFGPMQFSPWPRMGYFLINRTRADVAEDSFFYRFFDTRRSKAVRIGTVGIVWRMLSGGAPREFSASGRWVDAAPGWFDQVSFAKLELREAERFSKEVRVERFELAPNAGAGGAK